MPVTSILKTILSWPKWGVLCPATFGAIVMVISDAARNPTKPTLNNVAYLVNQVFSLPNSNLLAFLLVLALALFLTWLFDADNKLKAFYLGASVFSFVVTLEPNTAYKTASTNAPAAVRAQDGSAQILGASPFRLQPAAFSMQRVDERAWAVIYLSGPEAGKGTGPPATVEVWSQQTGQFVARYSVEGPTIRLPVPPGIHRFVISVPGFRVAQVFGTFKPGRTESFTVPLQPTWAPVGVQHVFQEVLGYERGRQLVPNSLRLEQVRVREDGEAGQANWRFDVLVNNGIVMRIPDQPYDNDRPPVSPAVPPAPVLLTPDSQLRVLGYRPSSVEGVLTLPADFGGLSMVSRTVPLTALSGNRRHGDFLCSVSLSRSPAGAVHLRFHEMRVFQDGAPGAVRWLFEVFLEKRSVFRLPAKPYTDDVGRYAYGPADRPEGSFEAPPQGLLTFRILGYREESVEGLARLPSTLTIPVYQQQVHAVALSSKSKDGDFEFSFVLSKPQGSSSVPTGRPASLRARRSAALAGSPAPAS